jgi:hypothetical protein
VRPLLATAGLLVLAGSAAAASPPAHTLRKSASGPIVAVAQDGSVAAWLTAASTRGCDEVHVLSPGKHDRSLPQPAAGSMTCQWKLADGHPQLAVAGRISTALWTLHEGGPAPFDEVVAASVDGPERQLKRLAHASDGTGEWLGGLAGVGRTLAYSWNDVEYVNPSACLSGGTCKQKIADSGIRIVNRTGDTPLPGAQPALQLAAAAGRIAYIPATTVKAGHPSATADSPIYLVDAGSGGAVAQTVARGVPVALALSAHVLAVLTTQVGHDDRISWFSATDGKRLGSVPVSAGAAPQIATSDRLVVYRVGRLLRGIATGSGRVRRLAKTARTSVGLSLAQGRLVWAENHGDTGRLRALPVG